MGYDIECIIDINNYPGEYFCPVCRTLVYPNEALLSQCAHLYCKPCLSYVVNSTKTCPYDGYLVTESDSKPLVDSDKALAENIGKVKVHCLFCRSGCTWTGALCESAKHISECTFGNSPVVCNRCQIQIMHRQVNEHAQVCSHAYVQAVGPVAAAAAAGSGTTAATTAVTQAQVSQNAAAAPMPVQNPNQQVNPSSQAAVGAPVAVPTPDQWYQQQYQQYYQQQAGYYQYPVHSYYPMQQYQQNPLPAQGQPQIQAPPVAQPPPQPQMQPQPLLMQQHQVQPYMQGQAQARPHVNQSQPQLPPQPPMQPHTYVPSHGAQPPLVQYPQVPQYQQAGVQMNYPQPPQAPVRPQMHPPPSHPPPQVQTMNQMNAQIPPQAQQYAVQAQPYFRPPPPPQPTHPNAAVPQPQVPQPQVPPVNGQHAYHQPQVGLSQQLPTHPHPISGPVRPGQQVPQQTAVMWPQYPPTGPYPHQQTSTLMLQQNQVPAQYHQYPPQGQASTHQFPHAPVLQPGQQIVLQQYPQQQPSLAPFQGQTNQQGNFQDQRPPGPPPVAPVYPQQSQNFAGRPVMPDSGMNSQTNQQLSGGFAPVSHPNLTQFGSKPSVMEQGTSLKVSEVESAKGDEAGKYEAALKNGVNVAKDGLFGNHTMKPADHGSGSSLEQESGRKSLAGIQVGESCDGEDNTLADFDSKKLVEQSREMKLPKSAAEVPGPSSTIGQPSHMTVYASSNEGILPPKSDGSHLQKPHAQLTGQPPVPVGAHGSGKLRHPGQSFNLMNQREPAYFGPPRNSFDSHRRPPSIPLLDQHGTIGRPPVPHFEGPFGPQHPGRSSETALVKDLGSVEGTSRLNLGSEPTFMRMNGGRVPDSSMFGSRDETAKTFPREDHLNPFPRNPNRAPGSIDKAPHGPNDDARLKLQHGGFVPNLRLLPPRGRLDNFGPRPEFGQHHMRNFAVPSPDREYRGFNFPHSAPGPDDINDREPHKIGEGSRTFNQYSGPANPFQDSRFPTLPPDLRRSHLAGSGNLRFDEHMARRPTLYDNRRNDAFGVDGPSHSARGVFSGPGHFSGPPGAADIDGPGSYHVRPQATEMGDPGNFSGIRHDNSSVQGFPNAANFAGVVDPFDPSRNGRLANVEWCRLCNIEAVKGLEVHSQTKRHQKITMSIVDNIKHQNKRKQRGSTSQNKHAGGKGRKFGHEFRGNKL